MGTVVVPCGYMVVLGSMCNHSTTIYYKTKMTKTRQERQKKVTKTHHTKQDRSNQKQSHKTHHILQNKNIQNNKKEIKSKHTHHKPKEKKLK